MKVILLLLTLFYGGISFSQVFKLEGQLAIKQDSVEFGQILVFSLPDSSLIKGSYIDSTFFSINVPVTDTDEYYAKLKLMNYTDTLIPFQRSNDTVVNLGVISLQKDLNLSTVEVVYTAPLFVRTIDGIKVNVEGTTLETLDNLFEVLKSSPRIMSPDDESIEIVGKGVPLIFVDRQPILSNEELKAIPSNMIERIEIITNPSSKYRAQGRSNGVIEVYTKKFRLEGYNMSINAQGGIISQITPIGSLGLALSLRKGKFSLSASLYGRYVDQTNYGSIDRIITDGTGRTTSWSFTNDYQNLSQNANIKSSYQINDQQTLSGGFRASGFLQNSYDSWSGIYYTEGVPQIKEVQEASDKLTWLNNSAFLNYQVLTDTNDSYLEVNLNYQFKINEGSILHLTDYEDFQTNAFEEFYLKNNARNRPNIGEIRVSYEHVFDTTGWKLNTGGLYGVVFNNKELDVYRSYSGVWVEDSEFTNSYEYNEQIGGLFFEVTKDWEKISIRGGLRGEITSLNGYSHSLAKEFIDSVYVLPFPSASIMYKPSEKFSITMRYTSGIDRPQFYNFDPFVRITDSLTRIQGNPYLQPATNHNIGVDIDLFGKYRISVDQSYTFKQTVRQMHIEDSTFVFVFTPQNADRSETTSLSIGFPVKAKWIDGWTYLNIGYNRYKLPEEFNFLETTNLTYVLWSSLNFRLKREFTITNQVFLFKQANSVFTQNDRIRWNIKLTKRMLNNKLTLSFQVSDIIPPKANYTETANNYISYGSGQNLFTDFQLGVLYKFGRLKNDIRIKETKSGQSDRI
ncbi:MAG: TonB-dependent receptor [Crocinitomicaceae bacterium]|nr:TonB-dependent receptor [Crocinitomicaceae bacterium]